MIDGTTWWKRPYWSWHHRRWERREHRFVAEVLHHCRGSAVTYVHPYEGAKPTHVVVPIWLYRNAERHLPKELLPDAHSHVEGPGL